MLLHLIPRRDGWMILLIAALWLAPGLLMAAAPDMLGKRWVYVCGSLQSKWMQLDGEQTPDGTPEMGHDCPHCQLSKTPTLDGAPLFKAEVNQEFLWKINNLSEYSTPIFTHNPRISSPRAPPLA